MSRSEGESAADKSDPPMSEENLALRRALEELEDVEVATFLKRVGKQVQSLVVAAPPEKVQFPERAAFVDDGKMDWIGYAAAYLNTAAIVYTPESLLCPPKKQRLSLSCESCVCG